MLRGTARQAHTENCRRRIEEELKVTAKAHAATRRMKEYQDRAAEKGTKRTKADQEEQQQQREHGESGARVEEDAPTSSSSGSGDVVPTHEESSSSAVKTNGREGGDGCKEDIKKRKAEEEHPEDPERDDGKWMRTDGNKRKVGEESEESRLRKTVRYLKEVDKMENKREVVEVAEVEVNEEEEEWMTEEEPRQGDERGDLDPEQVRQGREEEMNNMVKTLKMFEFGSWEDATSRTSKMPTTTKWVDRAKKNDTGKTFVRCRLVARDFKPKREGPRDDLFAAMPPLEAKKAVFAFVAGVREKRRAQGHDEVKLMFVDVKKAHLNAKCDEEEWVELPNEFMKFGRYAKLKRWLFRMRKAASGWEDDYARRLVEDGFQRGRAASTIFYHPKTQVRVVVHGDDITFAGTESELRKIEEKMHEWYDVKVRGILGSGKRDVHEIEILVRSLTWTEEGLEYEGWKAWV